MKSSFPQCPFDGVLRESFAQTIFGRYARECTRTVLYRKVSSYWVCLPKSGLCRVSLKDSKLLNRIGEPELANCHLGTSFILF